MRTIGRRLLRACVLTVFAAVAAVASGSACGLVTAETDCSSACSLFNDCGLLTGGSCGGYCAALVPGASIAGCGDAFDKQNQCAKTNDTCATATDECAADVAAFATCMTAFCKKSPSAQGCSEVTLQGPDGGS